MVHVETLGPRQPASRGALEDREQLRQRLLRCPKDGRPLAWSALGERARCEACGGVLESSKGVYAAPGTRDEFYEGRYVAHVKYLPRRDKGLAAWPLWLLNSGYVWVVRNAVPPGSIVVELGCGGGIAYFGWRYRMIGIDLSTASLERAAQAYFTALQCDATQRLPFADESVDAVVSASFLEHIEPAFKPALIRECHRVLKPGGRLVFSYDVTTNNPLIAAMRKSEPAAYRRLFLENDGHVGYEAFERNLDYFRCAGFRVDLGAGLEKTPLVAVSAIKKFAQWDTKAGRFFRLGTFLGKRPWSLGYMALLRVLDTTLGRLLPDAWSRVALAVCTKES